MNTVKTAFASSVDPTQISLSVESGSKVIIGIIGTLIAMKGIDASPITSQLQALVDQIVTAFTLGYTMYHTAQTAYGLIRKVYVTPVVDNSIATPVVQG